MRINEKLHKQLPGVLDQRINETIEKEIPQKIEDQVTEKFQQMTKVRVRKIEQDVRRLNKWKQEQDDRFLEFEQRTKDVEMMMRRLDKLSSVMQ